MTDHTNEAMDDVELGQVKQSPLADPLDKGNETTSQSDESSPPNSQRGKNSGVSLRWCRITKSVEVREINAGLMRGSIAAPAVSTADEVKKQGPQIKTILNEVSGSACPGEILALMGPSGSGKTSILDVLSGRSAYDSGSITIDGELVTSKVMKKLKKKVAYVKQSDLFFGHLTVRDQLTYTALLRLPAEWPKSRKVTEVNRIISILRLTNCADTPIFLLSGGERKRVNIGTELLTDPSVVILDEPTSGLDSTSAVALIRILDGLARNEGKTIITSIHQPSSGVFFGFHKLMLLADGNLVYYGTPNESLAYAKSINFECPGGYNAADHWMDLLVVDSAVVVNDADGDDFDPDGLARRKQRALIAAGKTTRQKLIEAWDKETFSNKVEEDAKRDHERSGVKRSLIEDLNEKTFNTSWLTQFRVLMHRSMKNSRSAIFTTLNLIKSGAIGLMAGLLWFQMPYTESAIFNRSSFYFFTMTYWVFDAMFGAFMAFPEERAILFKERASGSYHLSAYFLAKSTSEAPTRLILPAIYMTIAYWLSGVNNNFAIFLGSAACTLLSVLAGESIGLFIGTTVFDMQRGLVVMTVCSLSLMVAGGFFVRNMPVWLTWLKYLSPFKYAYDSSVQLVFNKPVPCDGSSIMSSCGGSDSGYVSNAELLKFLGVQGSVGFNVGMLITVFVVVRIGAFYALKSKKAEERT